MIYTIKKLINWMLPCACLICGNVTEQRRNICFPCLTDLPILPHSCIRCANILPAMTHSMLCGQCIQKPPPFDRTYAPFSYQLPISNLILKLKFHDALENAQLLGELMTEKLISTGYLNSALPSVILPVPLHPQRLKERGFNQSIEIARPIAKRLSLPLDILSASRVKPTLPQATLPAEQRAHNLSRSFALAANFPHQHVAVIDDVITTGHTIREFCSLLKAHGVKHIDVWCCARPGYTHYQYNQ